MPGARRGESVCLSGHHGRWIRTGSSARARRSDRQSLPPERRPLRHYVPVGLFRWCRRRRDSARVDVHPGYLTPPTTRLASGDADNHRRCRCNPHIAITCFDGRRRGQAGTGGHRHGGVSELQRASVALSRSAERGSEGGSRQSARAPGAQPRLRAAQRVLPSPAPRAGGGPDGRRPAVARGARHPPSSTPSPAGPPPAGRTLRSSRSASRRALHVRRGRPAAGRSRAPRQPAATRDSTAAAARPVRHRHAGRDCRPHGPGRRRRPRAGPADPPTAGTTSRARPHPLLRNPVGTPAIAARRGTRPGVGWVDDRHRHPRAASGTAHAPLPPPTSSTRGAIPARVARSRATSAARTRPAAPLTVPLRARSPSLRSVGAAAMRCDIFSLASLTQQPT
jgi:hypothetical protein